MFKLIENYSNWLHGQWPSGTVEKLPLINNDGTTALKGTYIVGDLTGVPLLKFAADSGAKAVKQIIQEQSFLSRRESQDILDIVIIGGGVSGYAAAIEAKENKLNFSLLEVSEAFSTIANFPAEKPIYAYPTNMEPLGAFNFNANISVKENLLSELKQSASDSKIEPVMANASHIERKNGVLEVVVPDGQNLQAHRVIIAIGRSGNFRKLGVSGEDNEKVLNRLHDPKLFSDKNLLVVGGGDSALEAAIAVAQCTQNTSNSSAESKVTLSYHKSEFTRPKPENIEQLEKLESEGRLVVHLNSQIKNIDNETATLLLNDGQKQVIANDHVLSLIGREAPLDFFRRSRIQIAGESTLSGWMMFAAFFVCIIALYDWKNYGFMNALWSSTAFPNAMPTWIGGVGEWFQSQVDDRSTILGTLAVSMKSRSFYYTLLYTSCIGIFGWLRIKRRQTPYVKVQTISLFLIQLIPLFILPEIFLPWLGYQGVFDAGVAKSIADSLFPSYISAQELAAHQWPEWGHPRAFWHAYGFILAWPLNVYNVFTPTPMTGWLIISFIQTFVLLPLLIYKYGKGVYCGWICSCGALAETLGDTQRHKMPHGKNWNRLNMLGQVILLSAFILLAIRIGGWLLPESWMHQSFDLFLKGENSSYKLVNPFSWKWTVDVLLGGILGVGLYFKYSGRVWCRFACPMAALMHIYARFSRFRIFAEKDKCISCNACTSVCHQGIDIMNFANKGKPMEDPECVRCSACVQTCPTGVLSFGEINKKTGEKIREDKLQASPVKMAEIIATDRSR